MRLVGSHEAERFSRITGDHMNVQMSQCWNQRPLFYFVPKTRDLMTSAPTIKKHELITTRFIASARLWVHRLVSRLALT